MNTAWECIPCFVRQAAEAIAMSTDDAALRESVLRGVTTEVAEADWNVMPVTIAQALQRRIRRETGRDDPYRALKERMNRMALELLPGLAKAASARSDPGEAAVRLAIAGNLLDAGSKNRVEPEDLARHLEAIWDRPLAGDPDDLFRAAREARCILYLADNAGEIVFDRLLVEALPAEKMVLAVRGRPVLNDATRDDAEIAGLPAILPVIDNGSDAPGTVLEQCSEEFLYWYNRADLIVAKGQGNYETLAEADKPIFFLFTVKCPVIAAAVGEPVGSMVVKRKGMNR
jgi:damage-control phosphatase, subfamily I